MKRIAVIGVGMDGARFRESVESAKATELTRLGAEELVVALTDGDGGTRRLLQAAANSEHAARETFRQWADTAADASARAAFEAVATQEADHRRRVLAALDDPGFDPVDGGPMHAYLRGRTDTIERVAAGMVSRPLVSLRTHARLVEYFRAHDESATVRLFEELRRETAAVVDDGVALLEARCTTDLDERRARMVAEYVVQVAYDDYADSLEALGVDPTAVG